MGRQQYLEQYRGVDIALDTYPYNGHTTTCDALWMGVPVVTLSGTIHVSRAGVSVLSNVGLERFIAPTAEQYVGCAVAAATDLASLAELRLSLRERMRRSPLIDGRSLTRRLEAAYRRMWTRWCESHQHTGSEAGDAARDSS
jgi:predicted O-linked N-acetylglucosamine transferase (SPINDLY family)